MPDIKKIIEQIRSKFDDKDNKMPEGVDSLLSSVISEEVTYKSELSDTVEISKRNASESKDRKLKLRDKDTEIETLKIERDEFKTKYEENDATEELENLRNFKKSTIETRSKSFVERIKIIVKSDKFELVKDDFKLPKNFDAEKEDTFDFSKIEEKDMESNILAMDKLDKIQYFGDNGKTDQHGNKFNRTAPPKNKDDKIETEEDIKNAMQAAADGYK